MSYSICHLCAQAMVRSIITYKNNAVIPWAWRRWIKINRTQKISLTRHVHLEQENPGMSSTSTHPSAGSSSIAFFGSFLNKPEWKLKHCDGLIFSRSWTCISEELYFLNEHSTSQQWCVCHLGLITLGSEIPQAFGSPRLNKQQVSFKNQTAQCNSSVRSPKWTTISTYYPMKKWGMADKKHPKAIAKDPTAITLGLCSLAPK